MTSASPPNHETYPLAAQIPLQSFTLPTFPSTARHLRELTLTSDISLSDYQSTHLQPGHFEPCTTLPQSITHLSLELFSLGFPSPFLTTLAASLPNLRSLTLFNCLFDGIDDSSRRDALKFFEKAPLLQELHVIDTFARTGFWAKVAAIFQRRADEEEDLRRISSQSEENSPERKTASPSGVEDRIGEGGLKVIEVSYTYRGFDESDFLNRVQGDEWVGFIGGRACLGASFNLVPPVEDVGVVEMQREDGVKKVAADGILPYASDGRASEALRKRLEWLSAGELWNLAVLNLCMFTLRAEDVGQILYACAEEETKKGAGVPALVDMTISVFLEEGWVEKLLSGAEYMGVGKGLQSLEIVGVPAQGDFASYDGVGRQFWINETEVKRLAGLCPKLQKIVMSILRSKKIGRVDWVKTNNKWSISLT